nr:glycosyl transferase, family 1 [Tanacetum cinerariifolium]
MATIRTHLKLLSISTHNGGDEDGGGGGDGGSPQKMIIFEMIRVFFFLFNNSYSDGDGDGDGDGDDGKKKGKSKSTNDGQFGGPSVKQNVRYEPNATTSAPMKGATTNVSSTSKGIFTTSNSYSALDDDIEEDVENMHDETANLFSKSDESFQPSRLLYSDGDGDGDGDGDDERYFKILFRNRYALSSYVESLTPMPEDGGHWSALHSWVMATLSFLEFMMFSGQDVSGRCYSLIKD